MTICTAVGGIGCESEKLSLKDLMGGVAVEAVRQSQFVELAQNAIEAAAARPSFGDQMASSRLALTHGATGEVGVAKTDMVSSVLRPGAIPQSELPAQPLMVQLEERVMGMYADLTNYQIAWKIAQRIQQDTSQLLKGS